jgi:sugar phosphate isomerase/epimerase
MTEGYVKDEHLAPGRGTQPVAEVLRSLAARKWSGSVIAEVHTHGTDADRFQTLVETRQFAQQHLARSRRTVRTH